MVFPPVLVSPLYQGHPFRDLAQYSITVFSLTVALVAFLSNDASEIGYVRGPRHTMSFICSLCHSARTGVAFAVQFFAILVGPPIQGALLAHRDFKWARPIAFATVSIACDSGITTY